MRGTPSEIVAVVAIEAQMSTVADRETGLRSEQLTIVEAKSGSPHLGQVQGGVDRARAK